MEHLNPSSRAQEFLGGIRATFPLVVGGVPFGIIYGAIAVTSGLSPAAAMALSLFVYAGSAQFIAVGMIGGGAALPIIWLTTFVVNVRHALYAASLAPYLRHLSQRWVLPLGFWLTDETFLVAIRRYEEADASPFKHYFYFGSALIMYTSWQLCTLIGVILGAAAPDTSRWGLDFAMSATFIGMIVPSIRNRPALIAVLVAAVVAVVAQPLPNQLWLILATLCGVAAAVLAERRWPVEPVSVPRPANPVPASLDTPNMP
jgi:4-azaleucine resistance transporter AzlC